MSSELTLAELLRTHGQDFLSEYGTRLFAYQKRGLWLLEHCQTPALGGHIRRCTKCGYDQYRDNSCRYRGCPQCEGSKEAQWLLEREEELLPVHYFHVVFTIPHVLNEVFLNNQRECFNALFEAAQKTLKTVGEKRIKAKLGFFSMLHTWGQLLDFHPHLHCVVPGGGISANGTRWIPTSKRRRYFAPTKVLAEVFRGILIKALKRRFRSGKLQFKGNFEQLLTLASERCWVVHTQPPFGSPLKVLKYLSRYTRKVALSNSRLVQLEHGQVIFSYKDYTDEAKQKFCSMRAVELIRRFVVHMPLPEFVRIRYYGFMVGPNRKDRLRKLRKLLLGLLPNIAPQDSSDSSFRPGRCLRCGQIAMVVVALLPRIPVYLDSS